LNSKPSKVAPWATPSVRRCSAVPLTLISMTSGRLKSAASSTPIPSF